MPPRLWSGPAGCEMRSALLIALWLMLPCAEARVSKTFPAGPSVHVAQTVGWTLARETRMEIDGEPAEVRTWASLESPQRTLDGLAAYYDRMGKRFVRADGSALGWAEAEDGGVRLRYLIQPGQTGRESIITQITSGQPPPSSVPRTEHLLTDLPVYPGGSRLMTLHDLDAKSITETSEVPGRAENVRDFMINGLTNDGWENPIPTRGDLGIWVKGNRVASFAVHTSEQGKVTLVRLLRERAPNTPR